VELVNVSGVTVTLERLQVEGDGADLVVLSGAPATGAELEDGDGFTLHLALTDDAAWHTGWFEPEVVLEASGGQAADAAEGTQTWGLPLVIKLRCDLDGDGVDAEVCGGIDCDDTDPLVQPEAPDGCDGRDNDCDEIVDEDPDIPWYPDEDGDGWGTHGQTVLACTAPEGYAAGTEDCDDGDAAIHPEADEYCNQVDDDCDGEIDEDPAVDPRTWYLDRDHDTWGGDEIFESCVMPDGYSNRTGDCDDTNANINPNRHEICDGIDQDCDGEIDEEAADASPLWADADGDGFGDPADMLLCCSAVAGRVANDEDCDDTDASINPDAVDLCADGADGIDNDCNGIVDNVDEAVTWYADTDADGYGDPTATVESCAGAPPGYVGLATDCDDDDPETNPGGVETCVGGGDEDCDGLVDCDDDDCDGVLPCSLDLAEADAVLLGEVAGDNAGASLAGGGDLDGDGYGDLLLGAPGQDVGGSGSGAAYLLYGPVSGTVDLGLADGVLTGASASDAAGTALAWAGDFDGDGLDDAIIGAPTADPGGAEAGCAYLFFSVPGGATAVSGADTLLLGTAVADRAGAAVAGVGDVDGDGLADVLVGVPGQDGAASDAGAAYLVLGGTSGTISLGLADAILLGEAASASAGSSVAGAGDLDGDGYEDMIVGAEGATGSAAGSGVVYVVRGPLFGEVSLADAWARVEGYAAGDGLGPAAAGDLDGDGEIDLVIGAPGDDHGGSGAGGAYLVLGPLAGTVAVSAADATFHGGGSAVALGGAVAVVDDMDGDGADEALLGALGATTDAVRGGAAYLLRDGWTGALEATSTILFGHAGNDHAGCAVSGAGDVDGNGVPDLLIGASYEDSAGSAAGAAYLVLGSGF
jgi:hypothetical protein